MITLHSARESSLDESFLNQNLQNAQAYDRIAGYLYFMDEAWNTSCLYKL
ncbi:MAG: hypothetical protein NT008_10410 [Methylococcales bacterium]|nr:hypothetical protein [Methylococcales bacterium]